MQGYHRVALVALGLNAALLVSAASGEDVTPPAAAASQSSDAKPQDPGKAPSITQQTFGQWALQCSSDKSMNPPCQIIYQLSSTDRKVATVISMARASGGSVGMQVAVPLGFAIQPGIKIAFGKDFSMTAAVSRCTLQGCLVEGIAPANLLSAMLKEKSGQISLRMLQGKDVELPINLDGFANAYKAMSART
jgi:invasion protein IalB